MKSRDKLKECLNCKHIIECWGLDRDYASLHPEKVRLTLRSRLRIAIELITHKPTLREFHSMLVVVYVRSMTVHSERWEDITQTSMLVMEGLVNASMDRWECPEEFVFERR